MILVSLIAEEASSRLLGFDDDMEISVPAVGDGGGDSPAQPYAAADDGVDEVDVLGVMQQLRVSLCGRGCLFISSSAYMTSTFSRSIVSYIYQVNSGFVFFALVGIPVPSAAAPDPSGGGSPPGHPG